MSDPVAKNGAESVLLGLGRAGVDYLFSNAGTDFPPLIEAMASLDGTRFPVPVVAPHETAAVGMAHGYYLVTGRPQAVMVHVNVGLANAAMGIINAASDNIPMLVMSGRTPITERGRPGARATPIQYGQEMFDQASIVRDVVKYTYEMRYPEQGEPLVHRALAVARSAPEGPVYLSLPREPLTEPIPATSLRFDDPVPTPTPPVADPDAISRAADWLSSAERPLILCQRGDVAGRLSGLLSRLAAALGAAVCEPFPVRNVMPTGDPAFAGYAVDRVIREADAILVIDSAIPWIEKSHRPDAGVKIIHVAPDPLFARMPVRGYRADLSIASDPVTGVASLLDRLEHDRPRAPWIAPESRSRADHAPTATKPMTAEWMSVCVSRIMDDSAVAFTELGLLPGQMDLSGPNRVFLNPHSGGLGWAMTAALGAQLADRERLVIACMGDGSYMFANPVACHQIAEALSLPILTIIKNNASWNAVRRSVINGYPGGAASQANVMPLTSLEPIPDFTSVARASRAHAERIEDGRDLPDALARAVDIIRTERRQVLLDLRVAASDLH